MDTNITLQSKLTRLKYILKDMGSVLVAFSGGVDSTFLATISKDVLGSHSVAVTAYSPSMTQDDLEETKSLAKNLGLKHMIIETDELSNPEYIANGLRRCYFCKVELYTKLMPIATELTLSYVISGTNIDDLGDYRPGMKAGQEYGVRNPMVEAGLTKSDIRQLSKERSLPTWDKPAQPCLSSRIPYGTPVSIESLTRIGKAESLLRDAGLKEFRVRHHDTIARIEILPNDIRMLLQDDLRESLVKDMKAIGYEYITLDLSGFKSGSLNPSIHKKNL